MGTSNLVNWVLATGTVCLACTLGLHIFARILHRTDLHRAGNIAFAVTVLVSFTPLLAGLLAQTIGRLRRRK